MATATPPSQSPTTTPEQQPTPKPPGELFHLSLNPSQPQTIVFLHGLLSYHLEWSNLIPHLPDYHLLLVDLPGHSASSHITAYDIPSMVDAVARLVRAHAHGGVAHIVGLSMGGFVTLDLARRYPELCSSAFVTGAAPFEGLFAVMAGYPSIPYAIMAIMDVLPDSVYWWLVKQQGLKRYDELKVEMHRNRRWEVISAVYTSILACLRWEEVAATDKVRVLNVAGGKQDDVEAARKVGRVWRENGVTERVGSRAVVVKDAVHAWDLQFPEVFAMGVKAWAEGRELPGEFERLD